MATTGLPPGEVAAETIGIRGCRVHNLRDVDLDIPRNSLVVITGPSGSGKSSLAFDTLYAEGQRQYIESLSTYARQFLHQLQRPDVDWIDGLQPTVCVDQRPGSANPRSTVATVTEIYDYLRLLYARVGTPACPECGEAICPQSPEQIRESLVRLAEGTRLMLLAPMVRGRKGRHEEVFDRIRKAGLVRARVDGEVYDVDSVPELAPRKNHTIEAVVDRIIIRPGIDGRLAESIDLAVTHGQGQVLVTYQERNGNGKGKWIDRLLSTEYSCPSCGAGFPELEPRSFSFNSPYGACPTCDGLGVREQFDPELLAPDLSLSLAAGAIAPWRGATAAADKKHKAQLKDFLAQHGLRWNTPLEKFPPEVLGQFFHGDREFLGLVTLLEKRFVTATRAKTREKLESFRGQVVCPACGGSRLRPEAAHVRLAGRAIHEATALPVGDSLAWFAELAEDFRGQVSGGRSEPRTTLTPDPCPLSPSASASAFGSDLAPVARPILSEIVHRLKFLEKVGLSYLTLDRRADSLSGGELQRVRLATGIGSGLVGVCYILDEPSIGLHPRDNGRLIDALRQLQAQENTVLVVEHDEATMRSADWLIDFGPGAGTRGGTVVAQGTPQHVMECEESLTGQYLSGQRRIEVPAERRRVAKTRAITIGGVTTNNLKDVECTIPLGVLVCVTGVSGSGKSSLVNETLAKAIGRRLHGMGPKPGPHTSLRGVSQIDKLVRIDQQPIGRTPRSNAATYTGVFDEIRKVFAGTREAKQRGYRSGRFSFNVRGGRCERCQGQGVRKIEMNFLPDLYVTCETCGGTRFNQQTLQVRYKGHSIADFLDMPVDEAVEFCENLPAVHRLLVALRDVGLGYLPLGQPSTTISGGEAQRIKLAAELGRAATGKTLYLLDEPTTGLHFDDVRRLLAVLNQLVDQGNTVLVIEHHLDVIKSADWLIDLGPEGGAAGGQIMAAGTPEEIAQLADNATGVHLRPLLPC